MAGFTDDLSHYWGMLSQKIEFSELSAFPEHTSKNVQ